MYLTIDSVTKRFGEIVALWIASGIYSAGVLLYGQRMSLRNVWRATRVAR